MSGDSHYHKCPQCGEPASCYLPIGDSNCGTAECEGCLTPITYSRPIKRQAFLNAGNGYWLCWCAGPCNSDTDLTCRTCGRPKPTKPNHTPMEEAPGYVAPAPPPTEAISLDPEPAEEAEAKVYECPCGQEHDDSDNIRVCEGKDCQEKICSECCLACQDCSKDICENCGFNCNDCSEQYCNDHVKHCWCCDVDVCKDCAKEHGIPKEE